MPIRQIEFLEKTCLSICANGNRFAFVKHSRIGVTKIGGVEGFTYDRLNVGGSLTPLTRDEAAAELIANQMEAIESAERQKQSFSLTY